MVLIFNENSKTCLLKLLLLGFLATSLTGCYSLRAISQNDILSSTNDQTLIHTSDTIFMITNVQLSDYQLSGTINKEFAITSKPKRLKGLHIYVTPYESIQRNGQNIIIPVSNIAKCEKDEIHILKTLEYLTCEVLWGIPLGYILLMGISGGYDM